MSADHTPTPWRIAGKGTLRTDTGYAPSDDFIGTVHWRNRDANAAFIVRAANCHDDLLTALKYARRYLTTLSHDTAFVDAAIGRAEGRS